MTFSSQRFEELCKLFAALQDGELDDAAVQSIERLILEDRDARRLYVSYMGICAGLQWNFGAHGDRSPPRSTQNVGEIAPATPPVKSPVLGFLGGAIDYVNHSRRLMFLLVAIMLSGWFIFQVGSVLLGRWWAGKAPVADIPGAQEAGPKHDDGAPGGLAQPRAKALAWLSGSMGGRWLVVAGNNPGGSNAAGGVYWDIGREFSAGQQVKLVSGLGEITFQSGAKVVLSAPAQFSVTSALRTDLQIGKLTARVPHDSSHQGTSQQAATAFTVNTPAGSVVDLGTEFGVEVTADHRLDVQVFVGEVKVNAPSAGNGGDDGGEGVHVTAGKTMHLEPGKQANVAESKDNDRFHRDLKIESDSNDKQIATYLDVMRRLKPVVWLRMEGKEGDKTIRDEMGSAEAKLFWDGPGNPFVNGRIGKGLWLRGPELKDCAILPDYPKAERGKLTVSAWVYAASRPNWATIARNWGYVAPGQFHFGLRGSDATKRGLDLYVGIAQAGGVTSELREGDAHPFPLNEWQHVAFVTDGSMLRLYREGREVAAMKHAGLKFPPPMRSLGIGVRTTDAGDAPYADAPYSWDGKLDEIAVFNEALSGDDIKSLAAAPPRPRNAP